MIKFARGLAACSALLLSAGIAIAQSPSGAPETPPAAQAPAAQTPTPAAQPPAARPAAQPRRAAEPRITAASPECAWSGRRILSLLVRDDVDTAEKHRRFYEQFGCPTAHIGLALRCVIRSDLPPAPTQGNVQQGQAHAKALAERVEQCWDKPSMNYLNR
jgi:pyruvate/2-oxoglutarate dehydrogenase complex dihydrolipoamide acyltransferase (E2) component